MEQAKNWWSRYWVPVVFFGTIILFIIGIAENSGNSSSSNIPVAVTPPSVCSESESNVLQQAKAIDFKQLNKDPGSFSGQVTKFTGQVVQVQENGQIGVMRLAVTKESYGWSPSDIIWVDYSGHSDAVQDDVVTVIGPMTGSKTYTSQANYQITIPSMTGCYIDTQNGKATTTPVVTQKSSSKNQSVPAPVSASVPTPTPVPAPPATWHTVTSFVTDVQTKTPPFTMRGQEWRITYSCTSTQSVNGFYGYVDSVATGYGDSFATDVTCPASNTSYSYAQTPGQYYFDLEPVAASVTVTIEDLY